MFTDLDSKQVLHELLNAALQASYPEGAFDKILPDHPRGRTFVIGAGKAAARMAAAFEAVWDGPLSGLVITRYGHAAPTNSVEVVEAGHPVPDNAGMGATQRVMDIARSASVDDLVVVLMSGGASSLMVAPVDAVSMEVKRAITRQLLASGAAISQMNIVRKALSAVKGGKLAKLAAPARVVTYVISDVPGDDPAVVGSGPSINSSASNDDAIEILGRYGIDVPLDALALLQKSGEPDTSGRMDEVYVIGSARRALLAAAKRARQLGLTPLILGDALEGEAREVGTVLAGVAKSVVQYGDPLATPCVILSGGETTVTKRGSGRGGRNSEFLLSLSIAMNDVQCAAIAADTDGIDGSEDNAGAWFDEGMARRDDLAIRRSLLANNDAYSYFEKIGGLVVTGPTRTNVNDFRAVLVR